PALSASAPIAPSLFSSPAPAASATSPLSLHDALPIFPARKKVAGIAFVRHDRLLWETPPGAIVPRSPRGSPLSHPMRTGRPAFQDRKSTRLNSSHVKISYAVFCLKKKKEKNTTDAERQ